MIEEISCYRFSVYLYLPVTGASISSKFFSWRRIEAPSVIILKATLSSSLPSFIRCAFRISTRGFPSLSNTSFAVSRWLGGNGTAARTKIMDSMHQENPLVSIKSSVLSPLLISALASKKALYLLDCNAAKYFLKLLASFLELCCYF